MLRKFVIATITLLSLTFGVLSTSAGAQGDATATPVPATATAVPATAVPATPTVAAGPTAIPTAVIVCDTPGFETVVDGQCVANLFQEQPTPAGAPVAPATDPTPGAAADTGEAVLAFTGSESSALGYIGAGMLGLGALAIAARRRVLDTDTTD